jgi:hypothetical protein
MNWLYLILAFAIGNGCAAFYVALSYQGKLHELEHDLDCWSKRACDAESELFWLKNRLKIRD